MSYIATLILYPLLTTMLFYLGAYATITAPIHTRYPDWLSSFMTCPACAGTWYGALVAGVLGYALKLPFVGLAGDRWYTVMITAGCAMMWTPLLFALLLRALRNIQNDNDWFAGNTSTQRVNTLVEAAVPSILTAFAAYMKDMGGAGQGAAAEAGLHVPPLKVVPMTGPLCTCNSSIERDFLGHAWNCPVHSPPKAG